MSSPSTALSIDPQPNRILVVRLGAMGDVIHTLPAVSHLKRALPNAEITWAVEPRWAPLLEGNPHVDRVLEIPLKSWRRRKLSPGAWHEVRAFSTLIKSLDIDLAIDFQGLIKSSLIARVSAARARVGFDRRNLREPFAQRFYTHSVGVNRHHVVEKNLALSRWVSGECRTTLAEFPLPRGRTRANLPSGGFLLASPVGGWGGKQWPGEHYALLAETSWRELGLPLLLDCAPGEEDYAQAIARRTSDGACVVQTSTLSELIATTRRARAVVGIDSGPLHLAAALGVPGVAIFGQTDPARNGPYGDTITVLRAPGAVTTYKRVQQIDPVMAAVEPDQVWSALRPKLNRPAKLEIVAGLRSQA